MTQFIQVLLVSLTKILFLLLLSVVADSDTPTEDCNVCVEARSGRICGRSKRTLGKELLLFHSVPFAEPPLGRLRFRPPVPLARRKGTTYACRVAPSCMQGIDPDPFIGVQMWNPPTKPTEDCLYLNIWSHRGKRDLPVMVWIYGGGFISGSPSLDVYNGEAMAAKEDVIVISISYRLGILGFGYLGLSEMPGNMGLLDQRLALAWIRDNIAVFGGDPSRITIFGESAGAAGVTAHILAPKSSHLFRNAIVQSGCILCYWALDGRDRAKFKTKTAAKAFGCDIKGTDQSLLECLLGLPADQLISDLTGAPPGGTYMDLPFAPTNNDKLFFGGDVRRLAGTLDFSGRSFIFGFNSDESTIFFPIFLPQYFQLDGSWDISRDQVAQIVNLTVATDDPVTKARAFKLYDQEKFATNVQKVDESISDMCIICCSLRLAKILAKSSSNVFAYQFDYRISTNPWPEKMGVPHAYEIELVFGLPFLSSRYSIDDSAVADTIVGSWTNLTKYGKPTPFSMEWPNISPNKPMPFKVFQGDASPVIYDLKKTECAFWDELQAGDAVDAELRDEL